MISGVAEAGPMVQTIFVLFRGIIIGFSSTLFCHPALFIKLEFPVIDMVQSLPSAQETSACL
jgi:hypothetical protein